MSLPIRLQLEDARRLARMDSAMRRKSGFKKAVETRVAFYLEAVRLYQARHLNELGELVPRSRLSERSLNCVFEDGDVSDEVVREIVRRGRSSDSLKALLVQECGEGCWNYWCEFADRESLVAA